MLGSAGVYEGYAYWATGAPALRLAWAAIGPQFANALGLPTGVMTRHVQSIAKKDYHSLQGNHG